MNFSNNNIIINISHFNIPCDYCFIIKNDKNKNIEVQINNIDLMNIIKLIERMIINIFIVGLNFNIFINKTIYNSQFSKTFNCPKESFFISYILINEFY